MVSLVKQILQGNDDITTTGTPNPNWEEGKQVLLNWQAQHNNTKDAFQSALLVANKYLQVKAHLPFLEGEGTDNNSSNIPVPKFVLANF